MLTSLTRAPAVTCVFLVNPRAAGGRVQTVWPDIERELERRAPGQIRTEWTRCPGDATRLVRDAVAHGASRIVSVGGDGTHNATSAGLLALPRAARLPLGIVPLGTGGDFRRLLTPAPDLLSWALQAVSAEPATIDAGRATFVEDAGSEATRTFLNIASFGVAGLVDRRVNASSKRLGGRITFMKATVEASLAYRAPLLRIRVDDSELGSFRAVNVAVANGRFFGGGMQIAPSARLADGLLDITIVEERPFLQGLRLLPALYGGRIAASPGVTTLRGRSVEATPVREDEGPAWLDLDGEAPGRAPLRVDVLPAAIEVCGLRAEVL